MPPTSEVTPNGTSGWTFQPLTNVSVTALGSFDYIVSSEQGPISVGLWAADGTLLASNAVFTNSPLINQTRYEPIDPVLLSTNETYYLGAFSPAGTLIINAFGPGNGYGYVNMAPEIQLGMAADSSNFIFSFPGTTDGPTGSAILAPNFEFQDGIVPPVLNIALVGNDVVISWSATYTNYALQEKGDLATTNWVPTTPIKPVCVNRKIIPDRKFFCFRDLRSETALRLGFPCAVLSGLGERVVPPEPSS